MPIKVAVRVRPFNHRERDSGAARIFRVQNPGDPPCVWLADPKSGDEKQFKFDYCWQSHCPDTDGIGQFVTQEKVWEELGPQLLDDAFQGVPICLIAYGATGAGKSYSMVGWSTDPEQRGLIPRLCEELFRRKEDAERDTAVKVEVRFQAAEVYCETVQDLLVARDKRAKGGVKLKFNGPQGYSADTTSVQCKNWGDIQQALARADCNRSIAMTPLNPVASRGHCIYTVHWLRHETRGERSAETTEPVHSIIHLVDLCGNQRSDEVAKVLQKSDGPAKQLLAESRSINLSLSVLANCITAASTGQKPPFKDSKLCMALQGPLTHGNTVVIAAISPAAIEYESSLSTLRFVSRMHGQPAAGKLPVASRPASSSGRGWAAGRGQERQPRAGRGAAAAPAQRRTASAPAKARQSAAPASTRPGTAGRAADRAADPRAAARTIKDLQEQLKRETERRIAAEARADALAKQLESLKDQ